MSRREPALDGLRAVAVLLVIFLHLSLPHAGGGWIGVDIFFVLSGFLITRILLDELRQSGRISLKRFFAKRAARLYPALVLMVLLAAVLGVGRGSIGISGSAILALTYTTNLAWLVTERDVSGLGHTWSLALEEQFYLLWPVLVVAIRAPRRLASVAMIASAGSFCAAAVLPGPIVNWVPLAYFTPHTHAGPILAGCAIAFLPTVERRMASWVSCVGLVALVITLVVSDRIGKDVPYAYAAESFAATLASGLLVVGCVGSVSFVSRFLAFVPVAWAGRISYGLYLYHLPLMEALKPKIDTPRGLEALVIVGFTFATATVSYYAVEKPFTGYVHGHLTRSRARRQKAITNSADRLVDVARRGD